MPLISCPDCHTQVSTNAVACPKCGAPVATKGLGAAIQTTERTSKRLKFHSLLAALLCCASAVTIMAGWPEPGHRGAAPVVAIGMMVMLIGLIWFIVTRIRIWWNHG